MGLSRGQLRKLLKEIAENKMPIRYKIDVLAKLKEAGFSSYRLRKDKIMGEATLQRIRNNELVSYENLERCN